MTYTRREVEALVVRIEDDFLEAPLLTMTAPQAHRRYHADTGACEAVLDVLAEARVLARTPDGVYSRWFPQSIARYAPHGHAAA